MVAQKKNLTGYPFQYLNALLDGVEPPADQERILLHIGEPQNGPPVWVNQIILDAAQSLETGPGGGWAKYPPARGTASYRQAVAEWATRRFALPDGMLDANRNVNPCPGTREALYFAGTVARNLVEQERERQGRGFGPDGPAVLMPNPFYHAYAGAAAAAGAEPVLLPADPETNFLPNLDALSEDLLGRTCLFYMCSPANPQGTVANPEVLARLIGMAREYGFYLCFDECYSEIYADAPPVGALTAAADLGGDVSRIAVFHSLSKRSSAPGLRSGFIAGDADLIDGYVDLIGQGGVPLPLPILAGAEALWRDEEHVAANREMYRQNFDAAEAALSGRFGFYRPPGGFFLWLDVGDGEAAAKRVWQKAGLRTMPGGYMARVQDDGTNPGAPYLRVALVHQPDVTHGAMARLAAHL